MAVVILTANFKQALIFFRNLMKFMKMLQLQFHASLWT